MAEGAEKKTEEKKKEEKEKKENEDEKAKEDAKGNATDAVKKEDVSAEEKEKSGAVKPKKKTTKDAKANAEPSATDAESKSGQRATRSRSSSSTKKDSKASEKAEEDSTGQSKEVVGVEKDSEVTVKLTASIGKSTMCTIVKCGSVYEAFLKSGLLAKTIKTPKDVSKALDAWADRTPQLSCIPMFNVDDDKSGDGKKKSDDITLFHLAPLCFQVRLAQFAGKEDEIKNGSELKCETFRVSDCEQFKASVSTGGYKALNNEIPLARTVYVYKGPSSLHLLKDADGTGQDSLLELLKQCQLDMLVTKNATIKVVGYSLTKTEREDIKKEVKRMRNNMARRKRRASTDYAAKERERDNRTRKGRRTDESYRLQEIARDNARRKKRRQDPDYRKREAARDNAKRQKRRLDPEYRKKEALRDTARRKNKMSNVATVEEPGVDSGARLVPEEETKATDDKKKSDASGIELKSEAEPSEKSNKTTSEKATNKGDVKKESGKPAKSVSATTGKKADVGVSL